MSILTVGWVVETDWKSKRLGIKINFGIFAKVSGKLIVVAYPFRQLNPET